MCLVRHTHTGRDSTRGKRTLFKHEIQNKSDFIYTVWWGIILSISSSLEYGMKLLNVTTTLNLLSLLNVLKIIRPLFKMFDIFKLK